MKRLMLILLCIVGFHNGFGQEPGVMFNRGTEFYRAGKFAEAAMEYQTILNQGQVSAELYFNLGNCYYRQGKIAQAILAFERARRLQPTDADIQHNLRLANFRSVDRIEPVPELFLIQWLRTAAAAISSQASFDALLAAWVVLFLSLAGVYVLRHVETIRILRWAILAAGIVLILAGAMLGIHAGLSKGNDQAIVTASVVTAKSSPDEQSVDAFVVHEGLKVNMSDALGDWVKITLADGKVGWVHNQHCERI
jgi:tetratricopeptide (TPR) repeat protein